MRTMLTLVAAAALAGVGCGRSESESPGTPAGGPAAGAAQGGLIEATGAGFAELTAKGVVLLEFYTPT